MVAEKLKATADEIAAEGWKWVSAALAHPYGVEYGLRRIAGEPLEQSEEEQAAIEALDAEYARIQTEYESADELPDEIDRRLGEIETALAGFDDRPMHYDPAEMAIAGVFVSVGSDGSLVVDRGYVRPEDEAPAPVEGDAETSEHGEVTTNATAAQPAVTRAVITIGGEAVADEEEDDDGGIKPLPDRLLTELTAHRTVALRDAVANNPQVAMTMLLHKLVSDAFQQRSFTGCLEAGVRYVSFPAQSEDLKTSPSAKAIDERRQAWAGDIPTDDDALWTWLTTLDDASRMALLAHCVSYGVNALHEKPNPYSGSGVSEHGLRVRLAQADRAARATGLDMIEAGWRPTVDNYLGRVPKVRILAAVREGAGERAAQLIDHLKKADMAKEAERLLADTGWLPEPLRLADAEDDETVAPADQDGGDEALPAFLADEDDEEDPADTGEGEETTIAAE